MFLVKEKSRYSWSSYQTVKLPFNFLERAFFPLLFAYYKLESF